MLDEEQDQQDQPEPADLPDNAADPQAVAKKQTAAGRREKRLRDTLIGILSIKDGREWIWALLESCNVYSQSFVRGEPESTAFNEGRRAVGNELLVKIVKAAPKAYVQMMEEANGNG